MKRPLGLLFLAFLRTASLCFQQRSLHTIVRGFLCWVSWLLRSRFLLSTRCARSISTSTPSSAYCVKLVFSCVVKGIKIKINAKFRFSRRLRFEDKKRIMSPEKFRDFRETGPWSLCGSNDTPVDNGYMPSN